MDNLAKRLFFWNYARGTWQYDLACLLIVMFIFLTPNSWFGSERNPATDGVNADVKASNIKKDENLTEVIR